MAHWEALPTGVRPPHARVALASIWGEAGVGPGGYGARFTNA